MHGVPLHAGPRHPHHSPVQHDVDRSKDRRRGQIGRFVLVVAPPPSCSTGKSWLHFRPPPVDFCSSRLAIGAATECARALAMPAGTRAQALQTRANSSGVAPASPQAAYRALLERGGSREPADRGGVDGIGPRRIGLRLACSKALERFLALMGRHLARASEANAALLGSLAALAGRGGRGP